MTSAYGKEMEIDSLVYSVRIVLDDTEFCCTVQVMREREKVLFQGLSTFIHCAAGLS